ncbi:hypothetical protein V5799_017179 [Amblyomma americanum]|uniref:Uncharacterized protein n=1 Tax=Amblyomma americanum TaxID=6943 RepID=A0AAQ4F423_AMBAM
MSDGKRSPSARYPPWSRRIFTTDRQEPSRARRAAREDASSRPLIQLSPGDTELDEGPGPSPGSASRHSRQATPHQRYAPLLGDAESQQFLCKRYEQGDEDLGCFNTASPTTDAFREPPASQRARDLAGLGDDLGDSPCFVAMVSQQRRPKSSTDLVLRARGDEAPDRQTEGVTQVGTDAFRSEAQAIPTSPSISVSVHREIQHVKRQHTAGTQQAAPVVAAQRRTLSPRGGPNTDDTSSNVQSTSTRKPGADAKGQAAPRGKRQGLTIDISFARSVGVDKEGKLLKSISTNVEKIVANILQRHSEDRQPFSQCDSEGAVIEVDSEACVSVGVTLNEARQRKPPSATSPAMAPDSSLRGVTPAPRGAVARPADDEGAETGARSYDLQPGSTPSSVIHLTVGPIHLKGAPRAEGTRKQKQERPPFTKADVTAVPVPQPLAIGPRPESAARKQSLPAPRPADRRAKPGKEAADTTAVDKDSSAKEDTSDIAKKRRPSGEGAPEESKFTVQKPVPEEKAEKDDELEKSMLKTEKRKSIQQEGKKAKHGKRARKASKASSSETGQLISGRKQSLMAKKQLPEAPPKDSTKETGGPPEDDAAMALAHKTDQAAKALAETKIATQESAEKGAESIQEHQKMALASEAAAVKEVDTSDTAKKRRPSAEGAPEESELPVQKPVPEEKAGKDGELEKSMLKTEKRKSIQQEGKKAKHGKKSRKGSKASSKGPPKDSPRETGGPPEDDVAKALDHKTDQEAKAPTETKISSHEPDAKDAEGVQEHRAAASEAATVKETRKERSGRKKRKDRDSLAHPELKSQEPEKASKEPGEPAHKLSESADQKDRKDTKTGSEGAPPSKDEETKSLSTHSILKRKKAKKSKKGDKTTKETTVGTDEKKAFSPSASPVPSGAEDKGHAKEKASPGAASRADALKDVQSETGERTSKRAQKKKSSAKSRKKPGSTGIDSDVGPRHAKAGLEPTKDLNEFLEGFERALDPYLALVGLEPSPSSDEDKKVGKGKRKRSVVRMSRIDVDRKRGKKGQSGETSPVNPEDEGAGDMYGGVRISKKDIEALDLEAEEEARKLKKERKKEKRKKKKRSKRKDKREQSIDYRSGSNPCRIVGPVLIFLLLAGLLVFIILKLLGSPATTTSIPTITRPVPPKSRPPGPPTAASPTPSGPSSASQSPGAPPTTTASTAPTKPPPPMSVYICETEQCKREGAYIATLLSRDSKPCDNFYGYVCDAWSRQNPAGPQGVGSVVSRDTMIRDTLAQQLLAVIRSAPDADLKIAAALHASCAARPAPDSNVEVRSGDVRQVGHQSVASRFKCSRGRQDRVEVRGRTHPRPGHQCAVYVDSGREPHGCTRRFR